MRDHLTGDVLSAFLDRELNPREAEAVRIHLSSCPSCQEELAGLQSAKHLLAGAPAHRMPEALSKKLREPLWRTPWWEVLLEQVHRPRIWLPAGAMAVGVVVLSLLWRGPKAEDTLPLEPLLAAHSRYAAENVSGQTDIAASNFSRQLARYESQGD